MDDARLDAAAKRLARSMTRRNALAILAAGATAGPLGRTNADASAACIQVGKRCRRAARCCSGICDGRRRKKTCRAHGVGSCTPQQDDFCTDRDIERANCNQTPGCSCYTTTGGARFCGQDESAFCPTAGACTRDAQCGDGGVCAVKLLACGGCPTSSGPTFCILPCPA